MPIAKDDPTRAKKVQVASKVPLKALVNLGACTGCEVCIAVCPVDGCIDKFGEDPASFGVYVNYDICIGCRLCAKDCPWDTIRMVPSPSVAGHQTSLDSQLNHEHPVYQQKELVAEEVRGFVAKEPCRDPKVLELFKQHNPLVPGIMGPK